MQNASLLRAVPFVVIVVGIACGGTTTAPSAETDGGTTPSTDAGGTSTKDGASASDAIAKPDVSTPKPPVPGCKTDADCNEDPNISALWGVCFGGICVCQAGLTVQPDGKCGKLPAPGCLDQGGKCQQGDGPCPGGTYPGDGTTNMSCGDFAAATCCIPETACTQPAKPMICCGPTDASHELICVNGWVTCPSGDSPGQKVVDGCG